MRAVAEILHETLTSKGIAQWLRSRNRYLERDRPIDRLRKGDYDRVKEAAEAFRDGAYL